MTASTWIDGDAPWCWARAFSGPATRPDQGHPCVRSARALGQRRGFGDRRGFSERERRRRTSRAFILCRPRLLGAPGGAAAHAPSARRGDYLCLAHRAWGHLACTHRRGGRGVRCQDPSTPRTAMPRTLSGPVLIGGGARSSALRDGRYRCADCNANVPPGSRCLETGVLHSIDAD
jgi:hypothetical protein